MREVCAAYSACGSGRGRSRSLESGEEVALGCSTVIARSIAVRRLPCTAADRCPTVRLPALWMLRFAGVASSTRKRRALVSHARQMLETFPGTAQVEAGVLAACIDACFECAQSCTACGDASRAEPDYLTMLRCITLCENCSDICLATGGILSRQTEFVADLARSVVEACLRACRLSAEECERHAQHHEHCRVCAEACRACEEACAAVLRALPA
jgi:hypothetical protein